MITSTKVFPYVIVTAAHNEEKYIEQAIQSVIEQTLLPLKWVIVSDGSTDRTDEIVKSYVQQYRWIELLRLPIRRERHFAAKALAVKAGEERLKVLPYDFICNMDADISFEPAFFEYLLKQFDRFPSLGIAGTDYIENGFHSSRDSFISEFHVNGQCQLFRRECWEAIGGYTPIKGGGIDTVAVRAARMKGWDTRSFSEKVFNHLRPMGSAGRSPILTSFKAGQKDYILGNHPLWEMLRCMLIMAKRPFVIGGSAVLLGYFGWWVRQKSMPISNELIEFHRREQIGRLKGILKSFFRKHAGWAS